METSWSSISTSLLSSLPRKASRRKQVDSSFLSSLSRMGRQILTEILGVVFSSLVAISSSCGTA